MGCCFGLEQQSFSSFATRERTLLYPLLFGECCMHLRGPPEPRTSDLSTQDGLIRKQSVCWLQELMGLAMPTLEQLKSLHLQHKAEITNHAWQRLLDLVLHLQARLPEGGIAQLLLLLSEHAQHTQQLGEAAAVGDGIPSIQAAQLGQHQAAGLQTCLVALLPLQSLVFHGIGRPTSLHEISSSLLMASFTWHHQQKGPAVLEADISSRTAPSLYEEAWPRPASLLQALSRSETAIAMRDPGLLMVAASWMPH